MEDTIYRAIVAVSIDEPDFVIPAGEAVYLLSKRRSNERERERERESYDSHDAGWLKSVLMYRLLCQVGRFGIASRMVKWATLLSRTFVICMACLLDGSVVKLAIQQQFIESRQL
jgi:hypothetical protein